MLLLTLLEYSRRWSILSLREYTIDHLEPHITNCRIQPCIVIAIARTHGIPRWIEPAIRLLRNTSLESWMFREDVLMWLNNEVTSTICVLREKLHAKRVHLAIYGLKAKHHEKCRNNRTCSIAWDLVWWATVSKPLIADDDIWRPSLRDIREEAEKMKVPGMTQDCFEQTMEELRATAVWDFEEEPIREAVERLMVVEADLVSWFEISSD